MKNQGLHSVERGSAVVWVFILIALFGILTVAMTRGSRTSMSNLDREQASLAASEIMGYAQRAREVVRALKVDGCSDTDINFNTSMLGATYDNTGAPSDGSCDVFAGAGGMSYSRPASEWIDITQSSQSHYGDWFITPSSHVSGIGIEGTGAGSCVTGNECKELIIGLPYIHLNVCKAINQKLGFGDSSGTPPSDTGGSFAASTSIAFTGTYPTTGSQMGTATPSNYSGIMAGCIEGAADPPAGTYHFFQVLIAR